MEKEELIKIIENEFRKFPNNDTAEWKGVCNRVLIENRRTGRYRLFQLYYVQKNSAVAVCNEIGISERTFTYWRNLLIDSGIFWAMSEFKLI